MIDNALYYVRMNELEKNHMPTKEVKSTLKVQDCDVMHLRESGKIKYTKKGNAYWYLRSDVESIKGQKS